MVIISRTRKLLTEWFFPEWRVELSLLNNHIKECVVFNPYSKAIIRIEGELKSLQKKRPDYYDGMPAAHDWAWEHQDMCNIDVISGSVHSWQRLWTVAPLLFHLPSAVTLSESPVSEDPETLVFPAVDNNILLSTNLVPP